MEELLKIISTSNVPAHKELLRKCYIEARKSPHPSTHNAALIVDGSNILIVGINTLPQGIKMKDYMLKGENKHIFFNHAEQDAVYKAAKLGTKTEGKTMVMPWLPCIRCTNAIISAGIRKLITHKQMIERTDNKWKYELREGLKLLSEAGVSIVSYDGKVGERAYMHGEEWEA
ncbi:MAG: hypothetical protein D6797_07220 [Bdellovibrio sp.]|nr:MAG: hypothetical protein D6797_07220 [Bdellovibrio sp.]